MPNDMISLSVCPLFSCVPLSNSPVFHLGLPVFSSVSPFYPMVRFCFLVPLVFYLVGQLVLCLAFCVATFWFFALLGFLVLGYFQLFLNKARFQFLILPASRVFLR